VGILGVVPALLLRRSVQASRMEIHGGNGYLPEQFLSSNINKRTDTYGGTPEKRCKFVLELMYALKDAIGENRLAIRLSPFGLYNQARGTQRMETWGHLCRELKRKHKLSYVHFIEPRYEQVHSLEEKNKCMVTPVPRKSEDANFGISPGILGYA